MKMTIGQNLNGGVFLKIMNAIIWDSEQMIVLNALSYLLGLGNEQCVTDSFV